MKLTIQIPCFNEQDTLPSVLSTLPSKLDGVDEVEWVIIDDGSTDRTLEIAKKFEVDRVICLSHVGLARAFAAGIHNALENDSDILVNLDADNQYPANEIPRLIMPLLRNEADVVIGERPIQSLSHFSSTKKMLYRVGGWVIRLICGRYFADPRSGFRAYNRDALIAMHVDTGYTYTMETLIAASLGGHRIKGVAIKVNPPLRASRLMKSTVIDVARSAASILRTWAIHRAFTFFSIVASLMTLSSLALVGGLWAMMGREFLASGNRILLCFNILLFVTALWISAFLADASSANRRILMKMRRESWMREKRPNDLTSSKAA